MDIPQTTSKYTSHAFSPRVYFAIPDSCGVIIKYEKSRDSVYILPLKAICQMLLNFHTLEYLTQVNRHETITPYIF